ncbi:MAG: DMT family transporter [Promethearchaeota archaeon]
MTRIQSYLSLIVAAICFGTIPVFSFYLSILGIPSLQQSLFRALFTVVYLFIILGCVYKFHNLKISRKHLPWFIIYGLLGIGASIIVYITAIAIGTPVVIAVSLTYLYPSFTLILARIFLKEHLTRFRVVAVPLSIIGAIVVSLPLSPEVVSVPPLGIILSLSNGIFAACYVVLGRKWGGHEGYPELTTTFWGYLFGALWMGPLILGIHLIISDPRIVGFQIFLSPTALLLLLGFALIGTTIPYTLTNVGVKDIDASAASIILLLDPISAVIMGYFFMGQQVALWQFIGAALILLATVIIAIESKSNQSSSEISG